MTKCKANIQDSDSFIPLPRDDCARGPEARGSKSSPSQIRQWPGWVAMQELQVPQVALVSQLQVFPANMLLAHIKCIANCFQTLKRVLYILRKKLRRSKVRTNEPHECGDSLSSKVPTSDDMLHCCCTSAPGQPQITPSGLPGENTRVAQ